MLKKCKDIQKKKGGFTIVECVIAIALIGIVTLYAFSVLGSYRNVFGVSLDEIRARSYADDSLTAFQYTTNSADFLTALKGISDSFEKIEGEDGKETYRYEAAYPSFRYIRVDDASRVISLIGNDGKSIYDLKCSAADYEAAKNYFEVNKRTDSNPEGMFRVNEYFRPTKYKFTYKTNYKADVKQLHKNWEPSGDTGYADYLIKALDNRIVITCKTEEYYYCYSRGIVCKKEGDNWYSVKPKYALSDGEVTCTFEKISNEPVAITESDITYEGDIYYIAKAAKQYLLKFTDSDVIVPYAQIVDNDHTNKPGKVYYSYNCFYITKTTHEMKEYNEIPLVIDYEAKMICLQMGNYKDNDGSSRFPVANTLPKNQGADQFPQQIYYIDGKFFAYNQNDYHEIMHVGDSWIMLDESDLYSRTEKTDSVTGVARHTPAYPADTSENTLIEEARKARALLMNESTGFGFVDNGAVSQGTIWEFLPYNHRLAEIDASFEDYMIQLKNQDGVVIAQRKCASESEFKKALYELNESNYTEMDNVYYYDGSKTTTPVKLTIGYDADNKPQTITVTIGESTETKPYSEALLNSLISQYHLVKTSEKTVETQGEAETKTVGKWEKKNTIEFDLSSYVLTCTNNSSKMVTVSSGSLAFGSAVSNYTSKQSSEWTFESSGDGYKLKYGNNYLVASGKYNSTKKTYSYSMSTTTNSSSATVFTVNNSNGAITLEASVYVNRQNRTVYLVYSSSRLSFAESRTKATLNLYKWNSSKYEKQTAISSGSKPYTLCCTNDNGKITSIVSSGYTGYGFNLGTEISANPLQPDTEWTFESVTGGYKVKYGSNYMVLKATNSGSSYKPTYTYSLATSTAASEATVFTVTNNNGELTFRTTANSKTIYLVYSSGKLSFAESGTNATFNLYQCTGTETVTVGEYKAQTENALNGSYVLAYTVSRADKAVSFDGTSFAVGDNVSDLTERESSEWAFESVTGGYKLKYGNSYVVANGTYSSKSKTYSYSLSSTGTKNSGTTFSVTNNGGTVTFEAKISVSSGYSSTTTKTVYLVYSNGRLTLTDTGTKASFKLYQWTDKYTTTTTKLPVTYEGTISQSSNVIAYYKENEWKISTCDASGNEISAVPYASYAEFRSAQLMNNAPDGTNYRKGASTLYKFSTKRTLQSVIVDYKNVSVDFYDANNGIIFSLEYTEFKDRIGEFASLIENSQEGDEPKHFAGGVPCFTDEDGNLITVTDKSITKFAAGIKYYYGTYGGKTGWHESSNVTMNKDAFLKDPSICETVKYDYLVDPAGTLVIHAYRGDDGKYYFDFTCGVHNLISWRFNSAEEYNRAKSADLSYFQTEIQSDGHTIYRGTIGDLVYEIKVYFSQTQNKMSTFEANIKKNGNVIYNLNYKKGKRNEKIDLSEV